MTKKSRTILFLAFAGVFLIAAPFFILYSQGYRIDFDKKRLTQTGGLFFKVTPKQVEIYINGKLAKKTDFFFGSALIENLLPKSYKAEIKKEGFKTWEKTLETQEKEVTSAKNVVLFAENNNFNSAAKNVDEFWAFPDQKKFILKESASTSWSLKLYEPEKNLISIIMDNHDISAGKTDLIDLEFSHNSKEIYLKIEIGERVKYYLASLERPHFVTVQKNPPVFWDENTLAYQLSGNTIFYMEPSGDIFKSDFASTTKERITEKPFQIKPETQYKIWVFGNYLFLGEGEAIYQYDPNTRSFVKITDSATNLKWAPDAKKIAFFNKSELWVMFLENIEDQPAKKAGDKVLLGRFSETIENLFWVNSHYLAFNAGNTIKITEIDDRDKINSIDITSKENPKIFWDQSNKWLYVLSEEILYQSEKLIQ